MTDHQAAPTLVGALRPLKRQWWVVVLVALMCAAVAFTLTADAAKPRAYGLINTRAIASLPNDRADLIKDVQAVIQQNSVLEAPAEKAGMSTSDLRKQVTVQQIGTSSLVKITIDKQDSDEETRTLMQDVVDSMSTFLTGQSDDSESEDLETRFKNAQATESQAREQVTAAVIRNGGIAPDETYRRLVRTGVTGIRLEAAARRSAAYLEAEARLALAKQATLTLQTLWLENGGGSLGDDFALPVSYQGDDATTGGRSTQVRRAAAGGAAGAVVAAGALILLARRRERATADGEGDQSDEKDAGS